MGVGVGLILIAFGAILTWGVNAEVSGLDATAIGVILLLIGILVTLLDLMWWRSWTWYAAGPPWRRTTYVHDTGFPVSRTSRCNPAGASSSTRTSAVRRRGPNEFIMCRS